MRIIFCDDDPAILEQIQKYVAEFFRTNKLPQPEYASYCSGDKLLQQEDRADIAFLDVEMPGRSGIYIGAELKERNPRIKILILTAYPDYLDEAMRFQVFRYLSKPIDKNRLFRNLKDALHQYNMDSSEYAIETVNEVIVRRADEILCVETQGRKTKVYTTDGDWDSIQNMDHWRDTLTVPCFYSPHRSFIVNMQHISEIGKDIVKIRHGDREVCAYVARRKYSSFKEQLLLYLESTK